MTASRSALTVGLLATAAFACNDYQAAPSFPDASPGPDLPSETTAPPDTADTSVEDTTTTRPSHCATGVNPGPAPMRRLTRTEYDNTVAALLGDTTRPGRLFPPEEETLGFDNNAAGRAVTQIHVELYMQSAERLIRDAMRERRSQLIPCSVAATEETICARQTITRFGRLAYRRPLTARETDRYMGAFASLRQSHDFDESIIILFEVILQSPHFLYRIEFGRPDDDGDGVVMLTGYELATRLSYLLWGAPPDDHLLAAAEIGMLDTASGIAAEARRMLNDPRAREAVMHFHRQWLMLNKLPRAFKDADMFPEYTPELRAEMTAETENFINYVIFDGEGDLLTLLAGPYTFLTKNLAEFYGLPSEGMGELFQQYYLPPDQRAGVLTHASMMTLLAKSDQTSPVVRGHFVREHLLCQYIAPPPDDIDVTPPDLQPGLTTRERFRQHNEDPGCAGCHSRMDPVGLPFENYDAIGRWRDLEDDLEIDATGELRFTWDPSSEGPVDNGVELIHMLAGNAEVRECYALQWFRYTHGRDALFEDECHMLDLMDRFEGSDWNIRALLVALTQTDAFRYRRAVIPGSDAPTDF